MKTLAHFLLGLCLAGGAASADDQVRRVQEALRKRNLYFGEIDGRKNDEVTGAIKRYQQRQGLPPTGDVTPPTLTSLGLAPPAGASEPWPEGPILKSDVARAVPDGERRRLEEIALAQPEPIAEPPVPEPSPPPRPEPAPPRAPPPPNDEPTEFIRHYLAACETNRLPEEMSFYGPTMAYFDHGQVDAAFVSRDVQRFYKRWPHRRYELLDCKVTPLKDGGWEARFRIAFQYRNDKADRVSGKSLNIFKIQKGGEGLHFVSMKEQVVRE